MRADAKGRGVCRAPKCHLNLLKLHSIVTKRPRTHSSLPRKQNLTNGNHHVVGFLLSADFPLEEL